jgi:hypothetical protein
MITWTGRSFGVAVVMLAAASVVGNQVEASAATFGARWQMNETSGAVVDELNGNNGTVQGGVTRRGDGFYHFDGATGYVTVPNSSSLNPGAVGITIEVAFALDGNPTPKGNDYDLVRKGLAGAPGGDYKVEVLDNGQALCRFRGSATGVLRGGTNLGNGSHVVRCIKTNTTVELWVDGIRRATKTVTVGSISNTQPVILGAKPGDDFTKGNIDYVTIT